MLLGQRRVGAEGQQHQDAEAQQQPGALAHAVDRLTTQTSPRVTAMAGTFSEPAPGNSDRKWTPPSRAAMTMEMTRAPMTSAREGGGVGREPGGRTGDGRVGREDPEDREGEAGLGQHQGEVEDDLQRR